MKKIAFIIALVSGFALSSSAVNAQTRRVVPHKDGIDRPSGLAKSKVGEPQRYHPVAVKNKSARIALQLAQGRKHEMEDMKIQMAQAKLNREQ